MLDVIIMACGSMEAGWQFCSDNGVSITDYPPVGAVYQVTPAALALGDAGVLQYLACDPDTLRPVVIGTLNLLAADEVPLMNDDGVQDLLNDNGVGLDGDQ